VSVVEMDAGTVLIIMQMFLNLSEVNYYSRNKIIAVKNNKQNLKETIEQPRSLTKKYSFFDDVYDVVRQIPKGRITSYGAIANYLGRRLSARMVGWAMNAAGSAKPRVPAHRVVNSKGVLTAKAHFPLMEQLLAKEKIKVENDKITDFKNIFWDPVKELNIE
jgi:methylated-DNA-protein-cysteine methyltransferase-like protein